MVITEKALRDSQRITAMINQVEGKPEGLNVDGVIARVLSWGDSERLKSAMESGLFTAIQLADYKRRHGIH